MTNKREPETSFNNYNVKSVLYHSVCCYNCVRKLIDSMNCSIKNNEIQYQQVHGIVYHQLVNIRIHL